MMVQPLLVTFPYYFGLLFSYRKSRTATVECTLNHNNSFLTSNSQLQENYNRQNGDGLSLTFLIIWLAGDIFNLAGIIMERLMFTMVSRIQALKNLFDS